MLIVNPNNRIKGKGDLPAVEPPLWAGLTASYLGADILDAEGFDLTFEETVQAVVDFGEKEVLIVVMGNNPSVSSTPKMAVAESVAGLLTEYGIKVSFTGLHPIAVDYKRYPVITKPFTGFPMMPWEQLPMLHYRAHMWHCLDGSPRSGYASIYTSLGCPFSCYYCNVHTLYGGREVKFRPIPDIIREVANLQKYHVKNIKIWDELFALKEDRVLSICSGLEDFDLNIWAYARLDTITPRMLHAMKKAGINWLAYGFESVRDPKFVKDTERVVAMTKAEGISIIANFMFGLPGTTLKDDKASLKWAKSQLFEFVNFYTALPYPGSQWYEEAKPKGIEFDQFKRNDFKNQAFVEYFRNPAYLEYIEKRYGAQAKTQIWEMLAWQK